MFKTLISCDWCKKEIDKDKDSSYYEVHFKNMPGWVTYSGSMIDFGVKKDICLKCAKNKGINFKD